MGILDLDKFQEINWDLGFYAEMSGLIKHIQYIYTQVTIATSAEQTKYEKVCMPYTLHLFIWFPTEFWKECYMYKN